MVTTAVPLFQCIYVKRIQDVLLFQEKNVSLQYWRLLTKRRIAVEIK